MFLWVWSYCQWLGSIGHRDSGLPNLRDLLKSLLQGSRHQLFLYLESTGFLAFRVWGWLSLSSECKCQVYGSVTSSHIAGIYDRGLNNYLCYFGCSLLYRIMGPFRGIEDDPAVFSELHGSLYPHPVLGLGGLLLKGSGDTGIRI